MYTQVLSQVLLQDQSSGGGSPYSTLIFLGGFVIIFYFFFIRPQQKKQKDQKRFIEEVKKGDQVVTVGGIHGKITSVEGDLIYIEVDRGVKLKLEKTSISSEASKKYADQAKS